MANHETVDASYASYRSKLDDAYNEQIAANAIVREGPTYHISTFKNEPILVKQTTTSVVQGDGSTVVSCFFIALNQDASQELGYKMSQYRVPANKKTPIRTDPLKAYAATAVRGAAIAPAIELVQAFYLQQEANRRDREIIWEGLNGNSVALWATRALFLMDRTQEKRDLLARQQREQRHWQQIWGNNGILGMRHTKLTLRPNGDPIQEGAHIYLGTERVGRRKIVARPIR